MRIPLSLQPTPTAPESSVAEEFAWGSVAEWATAGVALLALIFSAIAIYVTLRTEKRKIFIELHDRLTSADSQRGRYILHNHMKSTTAITVISKLRPDTFNAVNRALGLYNTLGIYAHRGYIDPKIALDHWGGRVRNSWPDIERYLKWRRMTHADESMWSYLVWFAQESKADVSPAMRLTSGWDARIPPKPGS